jgi:hypothetical protein
MSNKIPTAEEFIDLWKNGDDWIDPTQLPNLLIEFAKLHCEEQLKAILKNASLITEGGLKLKYSDGYGDLDKDSIINAYNLNRIK